MSIKLAVWYGAMPETNGKSNWTVILHRAGECISEGITISRSEYEDRERYEADRLRYLIGELPEQPDILSYDPNKHSGYVPREPVRLNNSGYLNQLIRENKVTALTQMRNDLLDEAASLFVLHAPGASENISARIEELNTAIKQCDLRVRLKELLMDTAGSGLFVSDNRLVRFIEGCTEEGRAYLKSVVFDDSEGLPVRSTLCVEPIQWYRYVFAGMLPHAYNRLNEAFATKAPQAMRKHLLGKSHPFTDAFTPDNEPFGLKPKSDLSTDGLRKLRSMLVDDCSPEILGRNPEYVQRAQSQIAQIDVILAEREAEEHLPPYTGLNIVAHDGTHPLYILDGLVRRNNLPALKDLLDTLPQRVSEASRPHTVKAIQDAIKLCEQRIEVRENACALANDPSAAMLYIAMLNVELLEYLKSELVNIWADGIAHTPEQQKLLDAIQARIDNKDEIDAAE